MIGIPVLVEMGVMPFAAHMFVFVFACFSCLTPPIAIAALPAAALAESNYLRTAIEASIVGVVGFIIPFLLVKSPELMLGFAPLQATLASSFVGMLAVVSFGMGYCGFARFPLGNLARTFCFAAAAAFCIFLFTDSWLCLSIGGACFAFVAATQLMPRERSKQPMQG